MHTCNFCHICLSPDTLSYRLAISIKSKTEQKNLKKKERKENNIAFVSSYHSDIALPTHPSSFDPMSPKFVEEMEGNLVRAYTAGKAERDQRDQEVKDLLDNLNPDNDPLMNKRRRRAVTIDDITAQVSRVCYL